MGDQLRAQLAGAWARIFASLKIRRRPASLGPPRLPESDAAARRLRVWLSQTPFDH